VKTADYVPNKHAARFRWLPNGANTAEKNPF